MARFSRSLFAFVLVFGFLAAFSLGVSADDSVPVTLSDLYVFSSDEIQTYAATNETPVSFVVKHSLNNWYDTEFSFGTGGGNSRFVVDSGFWPASIQGQQVITQSYSPLNLADLGYSWVTEFVPSSSSLSYRQTTYSANMPFYITGVSSVFVSNNQHIYVNGTRSYNSSSNVWVNINFADEYYDRPSLDPNLSYTIHLKFSQIPAGTRALVGSRDTSDTYTDWVDCNSDGNVFIDFKPPFFGGLQNYRITLSLPLADGTWNYQLQGFNIYPSDADVVDAIQNQTDDMNKNHDETMGKLDDMTSFDDEEQSSMTGDLDGQQQVFEEKLGILSFADQLIEQLLGLFEEDTSGRGLVFPAFNLSVGGESYSVWQQQVFDLSNLDTWVGDLMTVVRFATSFLVWAALVAYIQKIFSALVEDWSDR